MHIVTDENVIDGMESGLSELADNSTSRVQKAMRRFKNKKDINQNVYCYDEISVYSCDGFFNILKFIN